MSAGWSLASEAGLVEGRQRKRLADAEGLATDRPDQLNQGNSARFLVRPRSHIIVLILGIVLLLSVLMLQRHATYQRGTHGAPDDLQERVRNLLEEAMQAETTAANVATSSINLKEMMRHANAEPLDLVMRVPPDLSETFCVICSALCDNCSRTEHDHHRSAADAAGGCTCFGVLDELRGGVPEAAVGEWDPVLRPLMLITNRYKIADMCETLRACSMQPPEEECHQKARAILQHQPPATATRASLLALGPAKMRHFVAFQGSTTYGENPVDILEAILAAALAPSETGRFRLWDLGSFGSFDPVYSLGFRLEGCRV